MKRLFLILLAVLLAVSLSITMFPSQSVRAQPPNGGTTFSITAKGQGDYTLKIHENGTTSGTGEFSISVAGQAKSKQPLSHGYGYPPQAEVGGHISGSFDGHTVHGGLQGNQVDFVHFDCSHDGQQNLIHIRGLGLKGNFDGEVIDTARNKLVYVYDNEFGIKTFKVWLPNFPGPNDSLTIWMYETGDNAADIFKVKIREIGN